MRLTSSRRGFSLAEIMVALVILSVIVMGLASTTITFMHETTVDYSRVRASTAADTRIAEIRGWPDYTAISTNFNGVQANTPEAGWSVSTVVKRDTSITTGCGFPTFPACPNNDVTHVTVTVTSPTLTTPVSRSISIAAF